MENHDDDDDNGNQKIPIDTKQIALAMIPHTVSPKQLGMAFAVVEVLGNTLNMTDIAFGWLRDKYGNYDAPMILLLVYASVGTLLLWLARDRILAIGIGRHSR